jgi:predicted MFS family arabinose efflux permease
VFIGLAGCSLLLVPIHQRLWPGLRGAVTPGPNDEFNAALLIRGVLPTVAWSTALYGMYTYLGTGLTVLGYGQSAIAEIVGIYGAAAFAGAFLGGRIADRLGSAAAMRISLIGLCVCFTLLRFAILHDVLVAAAFGMTSLLAQIFFPAQQSSLLSRFPARSSAVLAWNNSALFLGMALGSLVGGQAMATLGFTSIPPISAIITILGWLCLGPWRLRSVAPRPA